MARLVYCRPVPSNKDVTLLICRGTLAFAVIGLSFLASAAGASATVLYGQGTPAVFPVGAQMASPNANFTSISCANSDNCTATGNFLDAVGDTRAFSQTMTGGVWDVAQPATFAAGVENSTRSSRFSAVSCTSEGACTAAGTFLNTGNWFEAFTQTMTNGTWANGQRATFAGGVQNSHPDATFNAISCTSAGTCTAAGQFTNASGDVEAFTQTMTNGTWANGQRATFAGGVQNSHPDATFNAISCTSAGTCTAAGQFTNASGGVEAFTQTMTNGAWANGQPPTFPPGVQHANRNSTFNDVACSGAGECTAAGSFVDAAGRSLAFTQTMANGTWTDGQPTVFAAGVLNANPNATFNTIACTGPGDCAAAGRFSNAAGDLESFTETMEAGIWHDAVPASFAAGVQNAHPSDSLLAISCGRAESCTAVGHFVDALGDNEAFTQTFAAPLPPAPVAAQQTGGAMVAEAAAASAGATRLRTTLTTSRSVLRVGQQVTVVVRIRNVGNRTARNVHVCVKIPTGMTVVNAGRGRVHSDSVCFDRDSIAAGRRRPRDAAQADWVVRMTLRATSTTARSVRFGVTVTAHNVERRQVMAVGPKITPAELALSAVTG